MIIGWHGGLAAVFHNVGLYNFSQGTWVKIENRSAVGAMDAWNGGLAVIFEDRSIPWSPIGLLYNYNGSSWSKMTDWNSEQVAGWAGGLAVDFGSKGLYNFDGTYWLKMTDMNPIFMAGWSRCLAVAFADSLDTYNGAYWERIAPFRPVQMTGWRGGLALDFGWGNLHNYYLPPLQILADWDPYVLTGWAWGLAAGSFSKGL